MFKYLVAVFVLAFMGCETDENSSVGTYALSCYDGYRNGAETGVDCGGECPDLCTFYENPLQGELLGTLHLRENRTYTLTGPLIIRDQSALEISASTTIKVSPNVGAYIAVAQGGRLYSYGSETQPIVFESASENPQAGDWGGIVVLGQSFSNDEQNLSEIGNFLYKGPYPQGFEIKLKYTKIKHTGETINNIVSNGLTLYTAGGVTDIKNVEISHSKGAAVKLYGGTVNLNKLYIHEVNTGIEITDGWQGTFDEVYMKAIASDAILIRNNRTNTTATPYTSGVFKNFSISSVANAAVSLSNGGGSMELSNWYVNQTSKLFDLQSDETKTLFEEHKIVVQQLELATVTDDFQLINSGVDTAFINESSATGAGNQLETPIWLSSWIQF